MSSSNAPRLTTLRLATRSSPQAAAQAQAVADALIAAQPDIAVELVFVETLGDQRADVPLHTIGGQGVFVKEVQRAVLEGHADLAAHSAKDLPSMQADGLHIVAFCARRNPGDALVGASLDELAVGATVATGSIRRRAQLAAIRPDIQFAELRGNIGTRLTRIPPDGAIVMAIAALEILQLTDRIAEALPTEVFVPSPGQGCVAVECRTGDHATAELLQAIDDGATRHAVRSERAFLAELGSGCSLPVGAFATGQMLTGFLADQNGPRHVTASVLLPDDIDDACQHAAQMARNLRGRLEGK